VSVPDQAREAEPYSPDQEAALRTLAQLLANVIKREVDAKLKASGRPVKSV
jgi:hypothetical protein